MSSRKKHKRLRGTVTKVIPSHHSEYSEKAEISVHDADPLYREVRVENELADEGGDKARLKPGAEVDVIIEAPEDATTPRRSETKHRH